MSGKQKVQGNLLVAVFVDIGKLFILIVTFKEAVKKNRILHHEMS